MADHQALFADRDEAGRRLAAALEGYRERDPVVVALPPGGVPVGVEVARLLGAPLDGPVEGRTVLLVDDGIDGGDSAVVAARALLARGGAGVVLAVPVGPPGVEHRLAHDFDEVICLEEPPAFSDVGRFYVDFPPVSTADGPGVEESTIEVEPEPGVRLHGDLQVPVDARGLVIFAHGAGSSRKSARNRMVAARLNANSFGTLLFDLLTEAEAGDRANVFDIDLLTRRLLAVTRRAQADERLGVLPIFYFGASTGAAAALRAAAEAGSDVHAVVSRGGRPDLAGRLLAEVVSPTLLIVGGADWQVLALNEEAAENLSSCRHRMEIVPGATHLFEEPGALDRVAELAADWFSRFAAVRF